MLYILADNQGITRVGIETLCLRVPGASVKAVSNKAELLQLLQCVDEAVVVLDYSLFDFEDINALLMMHMRFASVEWLLFGDEFSNDFLRRIIAEGNSFCMVNKNSDVGEIENAIRSAAAHKRYFCRLTMEQMLAVSGGETAPGNEAIVKLYSGVNPIFDHFSVTKQIKALFGRTVTYKHGAYLIIEHTEALHVVDVNSGNRSKSAEGQEMNALDVNLGAADELARQLRLRDMGGIIVVDFIDMAKAENRQKLYERMVQNMQQDRARHNILPLSKFGLMQITRQRVRPAMDVTVDETCPSCFGTGVVKSSIMFTDTLSNKISILVNELGLKKLKLHVHPYVAAYINKGIISLKNKWQMKYGRGIKVISDQSLAFLQYVFYDEDGEEIDMKEEKEIKGPKAQPKKGDLKE